MEMMFNILLLVFQLFVVSSVFSAFLLSLYLYRKTQTTTHRRTFYIFLPTLLIILFSLVLSYVLNYYSKEIIDSNWADSYLSLFFGISTIILCGVTIYLITDHFVRIINISLESIRKYINFFVTISVLYVIFSLFVLVVISENDFISTINNALNLFFPVGSFIMFIEALIVLFRYKKIVKDSDKTQAKYFIYAFLPQFIYTIIDVVFIRTYHIQITTLSYALFSIFTSYHLLEEYTLNFKDNILNEKSIRIQDIKERYLLSDREVEVVKLLINGKSNLEVGKELHISINTVKSHLKRIYNKMAISSRNQLLMLVYDDGLTLKGE